MTLSKSLRFEVLRRDGFTCTYCGRKPPTVELHVDHVTPTALGGLDVPENLRTACIECNVGKGSTPVDADLVTAVRADAERWAAAIRQASDEMSAKSEDTLAWFAETWNAWRDADGNAVPLPHDWKRSIRRWRDLGLPKSIITEMVTVAMARSHIPTRDIFNYFAGCCWRQITVMQERAAQIIDTQESE